jgi:hypothetical protein
MSSLRGHRALAKAKAEAMDRFLRDYDDYCDRARTAAKEAKAAEPGVQYILNLETMETADE